MSNRFLMNSFDIRTTVSSLKYLGPKVAKSETKAKPKTTIPRPKTTIKVTTSPKAYDICSDYVILQSTNSRKHG